MKNSAVSVILRTTSERFLFVYFSLIVCISDPLTTLHVPILPAACKESCLSLSSTADGVSKGLGCDVGSSKGASRKPL